MSDTVEDTIEPVISRDIVALLVARAQRFGRWPAVRFPLEATGELQELSWNDWVAQARAMAVTLRAMGFRPGDRGAIFSRNRPEWLVADLAILMAGGISVPLSQSAPSAARARMLIETRPKVVFVGNTRDLVRLRRNRAGLDASAQVVQFVRDDEAGVDLGSAAGLFPVLFEDALVRGRALAERGDGRRAEDSGRRPDDPATVIYSAGRTGPARGSVLTHRALVSKLFALREVVVLPRSATQILLLPLESMFGRLMAWAAIDQGATTWLTRPHTTLQENLGAVRPHFVAGVPAHFELLRDLVLTQRGGPAGSPGRMTLALAEPFLDPESRYRGRRLLGRLDARLARRFFRTRVRHLLGGRIQHLVCGGGSLDPKVIRLFEFAGFPILEGYGSNESVGAASANRPGQSRSGSVGIPLSDTDLRLSPGGEVLLRGDGMFAGYLQPGVQAAQDGDELLLDPARDDDGWFHTRDLGMLEDDYLFLTGRKEDIIRLSTGRSVAPGHIERSLSADGRIHHAVVCGSDKPYVTVLFWPAVESVVEAAVYQRLVDTVNQTLERHEQIKAFHVVDRDLSVENGEISTNGEPVRSVIVQRFALEIEALYPES